MKIDEQGELLNTVDDDTDGTCRGGRRRRATPETTAGPEDPLA